MNITVRTSVEPVIPAMHPSMHGLLHESKDRGWICYEEINSALPDEFLFPDKIDELLCLINALDIELVGTSPLSSAKKMNKNLSRSFCVLLKRVSLLISGFDSTTLLKISFLNSE